MIVRRFTLRNAVLVRRHPRQVLSNQSRRLASVECASTPPLRSTLAARTTSTRWIVSMIPTPLPVARPLIAWAYRRCGFIIVAASVNHARKCRAACVRVAPFPGQHPRCGQRRHVNAQPHQGLPVRNEVLRVGHAVPLNVRPFRISRVRPPVISLRKKIMPAAGAARTHDGRDRERRLPEVARGGPQHTGLFQGPEISGLSDCAGKEQAGGRDKKRPPAQFT